MAAPVKMPDFGTDVEEIKLVNWLKQVGDKVRQGEGLCEVETDKATVELESVADGVLLAQMAPAGAELQVGAVVAYVGRPGEAIPVASDMVVPPVSGVVSSSAKTQKNTAQMAVERMGKLPMPREARVSPMIRNLAAREGVDLACVRATGAAGQITRDDVLRAKNDMRLTATRKESVQPAATANDSKKPTHELSSNQRVVARRVRQSHREIVPINLVARVNMTGAIALRERSQAQGHKVSFDAVFIHAISRIISHFPQFRLRMIGEEISAIPQIHIGLAVSAGQELYTPTVTYADERSLEEIDSQIRLLSTKAREGRLTLAEMSGACFTISNLGMLPIVSFDAAIPPGQAAALAIAAIEQVIAVRGDRIVSEPFASVTLSVDHRLINGRQGAEFLAALKQFVEKL